MALTTKRWCSAHLVLCNTVTTKLQDVTQNTKRRSIIKLFNRKVRQRHLTNLTENCPSKLDDETFPSHSGIYS